MGLTTVGVRVLRNESNCAASGVGNLAFKKPSVTCTVFCAFSSLIPVFWTIMLISSFIVLRRSLSSRARARNILSGLDRFLHPPRPMERMERAGKPRHRWANPRGRERKSQWDERHGYHLASFH